ncbi:complement C1q-like protein 4 [Haliotis rufescens]|uniref:complement C1q-like protein 4 n=1 Tax=Haliotis rufescens TaxID=6454 RepID=UPI00201FA1C2|nr:complement C1q-like protein 4 [Haliotis rufescens]
MNRYYICALMLVISASADTEYQVAFSAGLLNSVALGKGETLCFDHTFLNIGHAYDLNTGIFTCPQNGIYTFQMSALTQRGREAWLDLTKNHKLVVSAWGRTDYATAANSVILQLTKGDTISVKARRHTTYVYGRRNGVYTTLSGFLVAPSYI